MRLITLLAPVLAAALLLASVPGAQGGARIQDDASQESVRSTDEYNLPRSGVALKGYDPVAYFPEGGGAPRKGDKSISLVHRGVTYRFATEANRERFRADPATYEPAYGGWCAWAMADGDRADIDPKSFLIQDGRLLVFYDGFFGDTRAKWLRADRADLAKKADAAWMAQSGESARTSEQPEG
ncbi:MAG: YHS domain-containing (seleno)protein [Phycisphaerales bacterium]